MEKIKMFELARNNFSKVTSFFSKATLNYPVVMAIIEHCCHGSIWVDCLENPSACLVISDAGYSFLSNKAEMSIELVRSCIDILKQRPLIKLIWEPNTPFLDLFVQNGFVALDRLLLSHPAIEEGSSAGIDAICKTLPLDCQIKMIDAAAASHG